MFGKKKTKEVPEVTSQLLENESNQIVEVFNQTCNKLLSVASKAVEEKARKEQQIIELQTEAANLDAVSSKATAMAEKIGGLIN